MLIDAKCDVVVNSMIEKFNAYIVHARAEYYIDILQDIKTSLI